jgi:CubicO group peptidase (beta-lactamase class C family)
MLLLLLALSQDAAVDAIVRGALGPDDPGAAVLVVRDDQIVHRKGYGLADLETRAPVTTATRFELASFSKQFTAFAILLLLDRGRIALEDDVRLWFPELPEGDPERPIRIRHLLHHSSGLPDHIGTGRQKGVTGEEFLERAAKKPADFAPGTQFRYSNLGYRLLAMLVPRATGKSLGAFLETELFRPAGMTRTLVLEEVGSPIADRARGYVPGRDGPRLGENLELVIAGEAGVWTCIDDLAKWDEVLRKPRFVRPETLAKAWSPSALDSGREIAYGFGWFVERDRHGRKIHHGGDFPGFATMHLRYPDRGLAVIVLRNLYGGHAKDLAQRIADRYLEPAPAAGIALSAEERRRLEGTYRAGQTTARIEAAGDGLQIVVPGRLPYPLIPVTRSRLRLRHAPDGYFADFVLEGGAVRSLTIEHGTDRPPVTLRP